MKSFEAKVDPGPFVRIHPDQTIVCIRPHYARVEALGHGAAAARNPEWRAVRFQPDVWPADPVAAALITPGCCHSKRTSTLRP